ncbi:hypothetical protein WA026_004806 [Henosepilachna vigintioctopunctata]|uniref:Uncharacterized protein n=1 Tax=Henosepilachna vigintioctopunctata TaxID=420089 RepID=A0AAW1USV4_9CUCU
MVSRKSAGQKQIKEISDGVTYEEIILIPLEKCVRMASARYTLDFFGFTDRHRRLMLVVSADGSVGRLSYALLFLDRCKPHCHLQVRIYLLYHCILYNNNIRGEGSSPLKIQRE